MGIDVSPSGRGLLILLAVVGALVIFMYSSGAWLTLGFLLVAAAIIAFILWMIGTRIARWGAGIS